MKNLRTFVVMAVVMLTMVVGLAAFGAGAADHLDAPLVQEDGRLDINDVYAFVHGDNTVLVMTVNPAAGVLSPTTLRNVPGTRYEFAIDNDGDYMEDLILKVRADRPRANGDQRANLFLEDVHAGTQRRIAAGRSGQVNDFLRAEGHFYHGLRDDPFFFDLQAFRDVVGGAGGSRTFCDADTVDFFAGFNTTAIVVEIPSWRLTGDTSTINVWARTIDRMEVIDRMGKPALNTVFIDSADKDAYNKTTPTDDLAMWGDRFVAVLQLFGGYDDATAQTITGLLLPDVLTLDTSSTDGFVGTLNGRQLSEDVIDFELTVVTGGLIGTPGIPGDCVDANDQPFLASFPYLADAN
ncbi:MAG: DUF4331 family protein [Anaerolineae bacterium]|uniref:DUF4331 family protein n=1 Tax=Promineifilum sp. TaxID=2664178 RepID=UPI001DA46895|nr:DUF4331 family protein [Anaerolineales bacterium]MCB8936096.1 DUF4331 family protein [Promineifilum sp.]MCO5182287.1 DUF4331 domain-containing protein [Promineifilum sp.]MCW5847823.1 DUF4331 family protein [Anaerolineae bacterium]